jgi:hypothetical protein
MELDQPMRIVSNTPDTSVTHYGATADVDRGDGLKTMMVCGDLFCLAFPTSSLLLVRPRQRFAGRPGSVASTTM